MARLVLERTDRLTFDIGEEERATVAADGTGDAVIPATLWGRRDAQLLPDGRRLP